MTETPAPEAPADPAPAARPVLTVGHGLQIDRILLVVIYFCLAIVAFVVVVGGVIAITDESYSFKQYVDELSEMGKFVVAAIVAVLGRVGISLAASNRTKQ